MRPATSSFHMRTKAKKAARNRALHLEQAELAVDQMPQVGVPSCPASRAPRQHQLQEARLSQLGG